MPNGKKQFQGKGRRFRGDVWLDEKITGRTIHALQTRGVKFPANVNPRGTREFKDEYKKQLKLFRQEHAAKSRRKKKRRRKLPSSLRRKKLHNKLDAICLGTDLHIDWLHPPEADCRNPRFRAGNAEPGDLKTNLPGLRPSRNDESHRQLNSYSERAYCPGEVSRRNERTNGG